MTNSYPFAELIDTCSISGDFGGTAFLQTIGIPIGTNCTPLLADKFQYP